MLSVAGSHPSQQQQPVYRPMPLKAHPPLGASPPQLHGRHDPLSLPYLYSMSAGGGAPGASPADPASLAGTPAPTTNPAVASTPSSLTSASPAAAVQAPPAPAAATPSPVDPVVTQALEIARESPDGAADPTISNILEGALGQLWARVQAAPDAYVMSRDEFSLFNFYQHRFAGDQVAIAARKRFWDNASA